MTCRGYKSIVIVQMTFSTSGINFKAARFFYKRIFALSPKYNATGQYKANNTGHAVDVAKDRELWENQGKD